ncbi:hypothetical protein O6H91_11G011000 [Diphasiastrum complanatum]|uniref:Uncharacterized protein n=2 Tax=Diphasiastrum complanatum TaxID=34168 RepID=A0ACC2C6D7_DIPCM|nr:hypothetical protein O6H91_11G007800 [Diphasiastrum complanatum]KAJ7537550.1 hypothetical protein O6H91_11G011000 [Diphasiastrum complanatum]
MLRSVGSILGRRILLSSSRSISPIPLKTANPQLQEWSSGSSRHFSMASGISRSPLLMSSTDDKSVTDGSLGIATGFEREELEAERKGAKRFDLEPPRGPFGTKEAPAIVQSHFDERIVGCSGGVGEDEHDVVWFKLKKGEPYECSVCSQVFQLEVVGEGGKPGGHQH